MKYRLGSDSKGWEETVEDGKSPEDLKRADEKIRRIQKFITEILLCENLLILSGLGTSLHIQENGKPVAPKMKDLWNQISSTYGLKFDEVLSRTNVTTA